jgi:signal transduction histidine kinase
VSELPLMFIFVTLTAVYVGWLARREAEERRDVERLHEELSARAKDLEATYQRCKEAQDHLVHSERLATIGRMSAEMAHQVRNPLSSISLNLELLGDEIAGLNGGTAEEPRRLITAIQKEIDNLGELTESYLRFANLPPFRWESADLNEVVREILVFARPQIEQRGVTATHQLGDGLPPVRIDRRQLKFAVMNVLTNALEAMASGGRLRMRTRTNGGWVDLTISDTGPGIPKEDQARIFEPFFTTKQGGTGLGLSLTRRIVEAHGGRADCESILQVGTSFTLSLPLNGRAGMEKSNGKGDTGG